MPKAWLALCLLTAVPAVRAVEMTCAWHFAESPVDLFGRFEVAGPPPLAPVVPGSKETAGFEARSSGESAATNEIHEPPAATVFVAKGDRLVDLTAVARQQAYLPADSWVIWNETQHLLIAHGEPPWLASVEQLTAFDHQPQLAALSFEWFRGGDPMDKPVRRVELCGRSGNQAAGAWRATDDMGTPGAITGVSFNCKPAIGESVPAIDASFTLGWTERGQDADLSWSVSSEVTMGDALSKPLQLLRVVSPSGETWRICGTAHRILADGTFLQDARRVERAGKAEPVLPGLWDAQSDERIRVEIAGATLVKTSFRLSFEDAKAMSPSAGDPFAESSALDLKNIEVPGALRAGMAGRQLDARPLFKVRGVMLGERDWVCYDPVGQLLHVAVADEMLLDQIGLLIEPGCSRVARNIEVSLRAVQQGGVSPVVREMSVTSRSGCKAVVGCATQKDTLLRWIVEPTVGDSDWSIDLRQEYLLPAVIAGARTEAKNSVTLVQGRDLECQVSEVEGKRTSLMLRADVSPAQDEATDREQSPELKH